MIRKKMHKLKGNLESIIVGASLLLSSSSFAADTPSLDLFAINEQNLKKIEPKFGTIITTKLREGYFDGIGIIANDLNTNYLYMLGLTDDTTNMFQVANSFVPESSSEVFAISKEVMNMLPTAYFIIEGLTLPKVNFNISEGETLSARTEISTSFPLDEDSTLLMNRLYLFSHYPSRTRAGDILLSESETKTNSFTFDPTRYVSGERVIYNIIEIERKSRILGADNLRFMPFIRFNTAHDPSPYSDFESTLISDMSRNFHLNLYTTNESPTFQVNLNVLSESSFGTTTNSSFSKIITNNQSGLISLEIDTYQLPNFADSDTLEIILNPIQYATNYVSPFKWKVKKHHVERNAKTIFASEMISGLFGIGDYDGYLTTDLIAAKCEAYNQAVLSDPLNEFFGNNQGPNWRSPSTIRRQADVDFGILTPFSNNVPVTAETTSYILANGHSNPLSMFLQDEKGMTYSDLEGAREVELYEVNSNSVRVVSSKYAMAGAFLWGCNSLELEGFAPKMFAAMGIPREEDLSCAQNGALGTLKSIHFAYLPYVVFPGIDAGSFWLSEFHPPLSSAFDSYITNFRRFVDKAGCPYATSESNLDWTNPHVIMHGEPNPPVAETYKFP